MPRNGSNVYSKPAGTTAISGTTIESAKYNTTIDDLVNDANLARPVVAGGTGATTAAGARTSLGAQAQDDALDQIAATEPNENDRLVYRDGEWKAQPGGLTGFRNRLINPLFRVDTEAKAAGVTADAKHVVEGWILAFSNAVTLQTLSRVDGDRVPYALQYAVTTGSDTSIGAGDYAVIETAIEGSDLIDAFWGTPAAKPVWVAGRIKAPTTGVYCVSLSNADSTRSYVFEVSCIANTYVDFEHKVPGDTGGTWNKGNGVGLRLRFAIAGGATFQTSSDSWQSGNYLCTVNQANGLAVNGNLFAIEDGRYSVGGPITTEWISFAAERARCERYYQEHMHRLRWDQAIAGEVVGVIQHLPTTMRATPTMTFAQHASINMNSFSLSGASPVSMQMDYGGGAGGGASDYRFTAKCNARLI